MKYCTSKAMRTMLPFICSRVKKVMVRSTINDLIEQIDQKKFIRIHRSYSVNINKIQDILPTEIVMQGINIPIGKSYKDDLL